MYNWSYQQLITHSTLSTHWDVPSLAVPMVSNTTSRVIDRMQEEFVSIAHLNHVSAHMLHKTMFAPPHSLRTKRVRAQVICAK